MHRCLGCARCRSVSYAPESSRRVRKRWLGKCTWHSDCELDDLLQWPGTNWSTVIVRSHLPAALPMVPPTIAPALRLAIATLAYVDGTTPTNGPICASVAWCQGARRLRRALENPWRVAVIQIAADGFVEACKEGTVVRPDPRLLQLGFACASKNAMRGLYTGMPWHVMLKWQIFSLEHAYDAVFFADLDIDVMPLELEPLAVRARWSVMLPAFVQQSLDKDHAPTGRRHSLLQLLGAADHEAPLNTGAMLARPRASLYRDGLEVLSRCAFNGTHGWEHVGRPRALLDSTRHPYVTGGIGGAWSVSEHVSYDGHGGFWLASLESTAAHRRDDWQWVAAAEDQGFFWYMTAIRHQALGYFDPGPRHGRNLTHYVHHYFGTVAGAKAWAGKPWTSPAHRLGQCSTRLGMNLKYLSRLEPTRPIERTPCHASLTAQRRTAEAHPLAHALRESRSMPDGVTLRAARRCLNWNPPVFAIW